MTSERTRLERLLHETIGARVLSRNLAYRHLHTHIFAYANNCVNCGELPNALISTGGPNEEGLAGL
jgi:hypothetical protein